MSVKQRLIKFLNHENLSQKRFAQIVGVSDGYVNAIKVSIQPKTIHKIAMQFPQLNTGWLLTGDGEMLKKNQSDQDLYVNGTDRFYWANSVSIGRDKENGVENTKRMAENSSNDSQVGYFFKNGFNYNDF